jgi:hypothetical protein
MKGIVVIFIVIAMLAGIETAIMRVNDPWNAPIFRPIRGDFDWSRFHPVIQTAFQRFNAPAPVSLAGQNDYLY